MSSSYLISSLRILRSWSLNSLSSSINSWITFICSFNWLNLVSVRVFASVSLSSRLVILVESLCSWLGCWGCMFCCDKMPYAAPPVDMVVIPPAFLLPISLRIWFCLCLMRASRLFMERVGLAVRCKVDAWEGDFMRTTSALFLVVGESTSMKISIGPPAVLPPVIGNLSFDLLRKWCPPDLW